MIVIPAGTEASRTIGEDLVMWLFDGIAVAIALYRIGLRLTYSFSCMVGEHMLSFLLDADLVPLDD